MCVCFRVHVLIAALLISGSALAQEPKAWLADIVDVRR
jgi:hypothetical protein